MGSRTILNAMRRPFFSELVVVGNPRALYTATWLASLNKVSPTTNSLVFKSSRVILPFSFAAAKAGPVAAPRYQRFLLTDRIKAYRFSCSPSTVVFRP